VKILSVIDEFTRECVALEVHRRFSGEDVEFLMRDLFVTRGVPEYIRSDNGPEFISQSLRSFLDVIDVGTSNLTFLGRTVSWKASIAVSATSV